MVNNPDIRYASAVAAIKLVQDSGFLDMREEDFEFLVQDKPWIGAERSRVRTVVEAATYGTLDYLGLPRMAVPCEFVAASIAYYVHPVNMMTACSMMDGCQWSDNIINGVDLPVGASELFAHVVRIHGGETREVDSFVNSVRSKLKGVSNV
jgi:hypothetical protein